MTSWTKRAMSRTCLGPRGFRNRGHLNGILYFRRNRLFKAADGKLDHCKSTSSAELEVLAIVGLPVRFDFEELAVATENLKTQIGRGGFVIVYRGTLPDETVVAVKKITNLGIQEKK
ncbi:hypothetical protein FNV43_RR16947 [Rhamnella rubrinervis]|uniref:Uncharacterized protein n=1 Tax=Rhamnella rubrinervis TaxID=2594499 RepID=A0A8K0GZQ1_9ROSA|nr:hypothetical protein FNV43_RR16947 [Rhamnella rubrinervis]